MSRPTVSSGRVVEKFSLPLFAFTVAASLAALIGLLWLLAPAAVWRAQLLASPWRWAAAFLGLTLLNCFIEYFFHRYVLHKPAMPLLRRFYRQHTKHHSLTRIARKRTPGGREIPFIENLFPITQPEQGEASFFPWYTLAVFAGLLTPPLALLQWLAPAFPWFFAGFAALAGSLTLYEVVHAIEHWSFAQWAPRLEHPRWGRLWRTVYSFHLRHHAVIDCNESISGFLTLPVADWIFGTCVIPATLYADGAEWAPAQFASPRPCRLIRWCDARTDAMVQNRRARARVAAAGLPAIGLGETRTGGYTRGEEIAHRLTHGLGLALSVAGLTLLVVFSSLHADAWHIVSFTVFGVTLLLLYAASTLYHTARAARWKRRFLQFDRAAAFLLIAGTCTPFLLVSLRGPLGWTLFGIVWGLCVAGAALKLFFAGRFHVALTGACLAAGWLLIVALRPLIATVPDGGLWLLLTGGLCYTVGTGFYLWRRLRYHHAVWHALVLGGSACHFLAVLLFLLPSGVTGA